MKNTKYEVARLVGSRALQIAMGAPFHIKLSETELESIGYNPIIIAKKELEADALPLTVRRVRPAQREQEVAEVKE